MKQKDQKTKALQPGAAIKAMQPSPMDQARRFCLNAGWHNRGDTTVTLDNGGILQLPECLTHYTEQIAAERDHFQKIALDALGLHTVHYILRWSGNLEDETPICGLQSFHRTLIGETHDSAKEPMHICPQCYRLSLEKDLKTAAEALRGLLQSHGALMPGLRHIAVADYANINEAPIRGREILARIEKRFPTPNPTEKK